MPLCKHYDDFPKKGERFLDIFSITENPKVLRRSSTPSKNLLLSSVGRQALITPTSPVSSPKASSWGQFWRLNSVSHSSPSERRANYQVNASNKATSLSMVQTLLKFRRVHLKLAIKLSLSMIYSQQVALSAHQRKSSHILKVLRSWQTC